MIADLLEPARLTRVVDIGANPVEGDPPYKSMLDAGLCTVVGFEPQAEALAKLNRAKGPLETYLPYAVGDGEEHVLHVTSASGMTSLLKPDTEQLKMFRGFTAWGEVSEQLPIQTSRLDDIEEVGEFDLLKIDVQGAELMVFAGGDVALSSAVAVHTEVSFMPLYENQPTFADIDRDLRARGFVPHHFSAIKKWAIAPVIFGGDFRTGRNQLLEADVVYVRDFTKPELMSDEQLRQLALIAHHVYGSYDLTCRCLIDLAERGQCEQDAPARYLETVS